MKSVLALSALAALSASSVLANSHDHHDRQALHRRAASRQAGLVRRNKPTHDGTALWFEETGAKGACEQVNTNDDLVVGLSTEFWKDTGVVSDLCGKTVVITNTGNNKSVTVVVADASGKEYTTLTRAAFSQLAPLHVGMIPISYHFADATTVPTNGASASSSASAKGASSGSGVFKSSEGAVKAAVVATPAAITTPAPVTTPAPTSSFDSASAAAAASKEAADAASSAKAYAASQKALVLAASQSAEAAAAASSSRAAAAAASSQAAAEEAAASSKAAAEAAASSAAADAAASAKAALKSAAQSAAKVFTGGIATYFYQNGVAGNCGKVNSDSTPLVALPTATYAGGKYCGQTVTIKRLDTGKTITALVADSCPTCDNNNCLDLSWGAFSSLGGTENMGIFDIEWWFN
ncbi:hypothetical protein JCM10213_007996 [Rhodosporidiobolus nylandii]